MGRTTPRGLVPGHGLLCPGEVRCRLDEDRHGPVLQGPFGDYYDVFVDRVIGRRRFIWRFSVDPGLPRRHGSSRSTSGRRSRRCSSSLCLKV